MNHLIILPGWQQNAQHWASVHTLLQDSGVPHTIIDLPGFGAQPFDETLIDLQSIARWVETKISEAHLLSDIVLVGHSYGGRVAVCIASSGKLRLSKLVLIGAPCVYMPTLKTRLFTLLSRIAHPFKKFVPESFRSKLRSADYEAVMHSPLQKLFINIIGSDQTELLAKLSIPVQLLWGHNDAQAPLSVGMKMQTLLEQCELEVVEDAGHDLHLEKPNWLAAKLTSYAKAS